MGLSVNGYRVEQYENMDGNFVESQHVRIQEKKWDLKKQQESSFFHSHSYSVSWSWSTQAVQAFLLRLL